MWTRWRQWRNRRFFVVRWIGFTSGRITAMLWFGSIAGAGEKAPEIVSRFCMRGRTGWPYRSGSDVSLFTMENFISTEPAIRLRYITLPRPLRRILRGRCWKSWTPIFIMASTATAFIRPGFTVCGMRACIKTRASVRKTSLKTPFVHCRFRNSPPLSLTNRGRISRRFSAIPARRTLFGIPTWAGRLLARL